MDRFKSPDQLNQPGLYISWVARTFLLFANGHCKELYPMQIKMKPVTVRIAMERSFR